MFHSVPCVPSVEKWSAFRYWCCQQLLLGRLVERKSMAANTPLPLHNPARPSQELPYTHKFSKPRRAKSLS